MRIATVLGTRPEIIRLSRIIPLLDQACEHTLIHTGQNYTATLNDVFFEELGVRTPDHWLESRADSFSGQVAQILTGCEALFRELQPDRLLILGDTNSGLSAFVAKRMGIPVFHMEAGNRCYDDRVPEEVNRRVIDHSSDILLPYTEGSRRHLLREGIPHPRIYVTGNPIYEVLNHYQPQILASKILHDLGLEKGKYLLVTLHRQENVDQPARLADFFEAFDLLAHHFQWPIICSTHPRTRSQLAKQGLNPPEQVRLLEPFGLFDFVHLEQNAACVLSDSGTVQEECCLFKVPSVTLRDVTERPETLEVGSNILSGSQPGRILNAVKLALSRPPTWVPPPEYLVPDVSQTVLKILTSYYPDFESSHG